MTLVVSTASFRTATAHRFDITRKSGGEAGHPFAPSWQLLRWALGEIRAGRGEEAWPKYRRSFINEMRRSYVDRVDAWHALLARESVTLVCYCADVDRCHRGVLLELLVLLGAKEGTRK